MTGESRAAHWSSVTAQRLAEAVKAHRERVRAMNRVAQGEELLTGEQRLSLKASEGRIRRLIEELQDGVRARQSVVTMEQVTAQREAVPEALREAYEVLFCRVYGSDPAISSGDPAVERGAGKRETRLSTGVEPGRVPGVNGARGKYGQGVRNTIKDRRAYEEKLKIDRRLRRIAGEVREFLAGGDSINTVRVCVRCARIGEDDWNWCPHCGHEMKDEQR